MAIKAGPVLDMIQDRSNYYGMDESLFTALKDIFDAIKGNSSHVGVVSPHKFLDILRRDNEMFRSAMHQDAHEFLNLLLNQVVDSVELFSKQHPTLIGAPKEAAEVDGTVATVDSNNGIDTRWVHDLFEGLLTSETRCLTCENTSQRDEPFLDLSVDLSSHTSVTSCLRKFCEEEMLCERNKFHCDNCGGLQEAEKRMKIKRLPRVLALHLKRFKYTEDLQRLQKLFHRVVYPFHLRLFNTTDDAADPDRLYELYAVVVHIGGGPYHGHYVSIVKTKDRGWLLFDDELVEPVDKSYVQSFFGGEPIPGLQDARQLACAYVLFYQETTLEAMLREQELEGRQPTAAAATATAPTTNGVTTDHDTTPREPLSNLNPLTNGLFRPHASAPAIPATFAARTSNSAIVDDASDSSNTPLTHAVTAPDNVLPPSSVALQSIETPRTKSKKELKAEEKERKAAAKAEAKALDEKRRAESHRRLDAWRQAQHEMAAAVEASRQTAVDEAQARGEDVSDLVPAKESHAGGNPVGGGGLKLSRLRPGSISLRNKPKWIVGNTNGNTEKVGKGGSEKSHVESTKPLTSMKEDVETRETATLDKSGPTVTATTTNRSSGLPQIPPIPAPEDRVKRNRFSLGRKRSQAMA